MLTHLVPGVNRRAGERMVNFLASSQVFAFGAMAASRAKPQHT